jgi:hypothetical protein
MSTTTRKKFITQLAGMAAIGIGATACAINRCAQNKSFAPYKWLQV